MVESIFFAKEGEKGITRTSAAHLCALATGVKEEAESFLNNIQHESSEKFQTKKSKNN